MLIQGSNMAENHPVAFRAIVEAKRRGATILHVDPRFTRTSALADVHVPIRAGTDIAFLGGLVRYVIEHERAFREYLLAFTNAATLVSPDFRDTEDLDGLFSGYDHEGRQYDPRTWQYEGVRSVPAAGDKEQVKQLGGHGSDEPAQRRPLRDETLEHPRCVYQVLKRHFSRYTPEVVERICGIPRARFEQVAKLLCDNSGRERTTGICYSVGWTQHTVGVQYIRTAAILQLLLGNVGRPGGGVMALRGHASIQGSTDIPTLFELLPGYLPMPKTAHRHELGRYIDDVRSPTGWWSELPKYLVSLLKAWYGEAATAENGWRFEWLPPVSGEHSHLQTVAKMCDGEIDGYLVLGENPVVGSPNGRMQREGLRKLEWLVVRDFAPTETAEFWREGAEAIDTEVFFFPAAAHTEKSGSYTNTQRLLQWHQQAVEPPGDARSDLWWVFHLGLRLKALYGDSDPTLAALTWDYPTEGPHEEPSAEAVLKEINGRSLSDGRLLSSFTELKDDGSTACGCWIYTGCFAGGENQTARRKPRTEQTRFAQEWGWAWPANRRILYNRASADREGRPWSDRKRLVWWDANVGKWTGLDVPDFIADRPPDYVPPEDAQGLDTIGGDHAFIMQPDGKGWLFAPSGLLDGPLPTHYEPAETVAPNLLYGQQCNPVRLQWRRPENPTTRAKGDPSYPYVLTTFRLTEHHTAGGMSRTLPWLSELQPEMFCEISPQLAADLGVRTGDEVTLSSPRAAITCRAMVTERLTPLWVDGRLVHQVAVPWHFGTVGLATGASANDLLELVGDPNSHIQESKVLCVDLRKGRHPARAPAPDARDGRDLPGVGQKGPRPDEIED